MRRLTLLPDIRNNIEIRRLMRAFQLRVPSAIVFMKMVNAVGQVSFIMDESTTILHVPNLARDLMFVVTAMGSGAVILICKSPAIHRNIGPRQARLSAESNVDSQERMGCLGYSIYFFFWTLAILSFKQPDTCSMMEQLIWKILLARSHNCPYNGHL